MMTYVNVKKKQKKALIVFLLHCKVKSFLYLDCDMKVYCDQVLRG